MSLRALHRAADVFSHVVVMWWVCRRSRSRFFAMRVIPIPIKTHGLLSVSVIIRAYPKCSAPARRPLKRTSTGRNQVNHQKWGALVRASRV